MIDDCAMLDLPCVGGLYTWHHKCVGARHVAKTLDMGLANLGWKGSLLEAYVEVLCRLHSGHNLLLLWCGGLPQVRSFLKNSFVHLMVPLPSRFLSKVFLTHRRDGTTTN